MPDREALTGFVIPWVPVAVLCQGTEQLFPPTSHDYQWLRHGPAGWPGHWGASPGRFHGNGSPVMSKGSCCHQQGSRKGTVRLSQGAAGYSSRGWAPLGTSKGWDGFVEPSQEHLRWLWRGHLAHTWL